jgi:hypothetical protein
VATGWRRSRFSISRGGDGYGGRHGWANSPADLTAFDDSYAEGETVSALVSRDLAEVLHGVLLMDQMCALPEATLTEV